MDSVQISFGAANRSLAGYFFPRFLTYKQEREPVRSIANAKPHNNVVLIFDESVRADHLSLNGYARATSPYLEELRNGGSLANFGTAISASTRSLESLQLALTGLSQKDLSDLEGKLDRYPTIFQYAKAAGYRTIYFDGQINDFWSGRSDDLKYIDVMMSAQNINPDNEPEWDNDRKIATDVREIISTSSGNFIFVFKYGNHTAYVNDFPADDAVWRPSSTSIDYSSMMMDHDVLINTYDNALRYNLETFFRTLIPPGSRLPGNTTVLYTSDHGQTLSDNGEEWTHGGQSINEALVPLFILGKEDYHFDTGFKASHENTLPTLLDLMDFSDEKRAHTYAESLFKAKSSDSKDRYFIIPDFSRKTAIRVPTECCH